MNFVRYAVLSATLAFSALPAVAEESAQYQNLLTPLLQSSTDVVDQPLVYPEGKPNVTAGIVTIPPGGETGWHMHEVPLFVYILEGEVTVDYGDKGIKVYKTGGSVMEAMDIPHNGMNKGTGPLRILAVYMGGGDKTNTAKTDAPK